MTKRVLTGVFSALLLVCLTHADVRAQATAQISGIVKDASGAVLPGVDVTATHTETGFVRSSLTNESGAYTLPNLPIGLYRLDARLQGFRAMTQTGIILQVNSSPAIDVVLQIGEIAETVTVSGTATVVETRRTGIGQVMETERILELPLNGRNAASLLQTMPAAVPVPQLNSSSRSLAGGLAYAIAGGLPFGVSHVLDGAMHNNPYDNLNLPLPFPDALAEFRAEMSALTAQNGMHSGGAVNYVTKSGTNQFHGSAFEFLRHHKLNATDPFAARNADGTRKSDGLKRNQYGMTLGGPLATDRLFFFFAYQGTNIRVIPVDNRAFIPTAQMLAGDFRTFASPTCNNGVQRTLLPPFVGNQVDPALFSRAAVTIANRLPIASADPCGLVIYGVPNERDDHEPIGKVDYQINAAHRMFGRYLAYKDFSPPPFDLEGGSLLATNTGGRDNLGQMFTAGEDWLLSSSTLNTVRFAFNRTAIHRTAGNFFSAPDVGINIYSYTPDYMLLSVAPSGFALGSGIQSDSTFDTDAYQISDDVTIARGNHQFGFGVSVAHWASLSLANVRSPGQLNVGNTATGVALGDFMLGRLALLQQAAPNTLDMTQTYLGAYAQDTWRMTPRMTLNYGLRWEPFFPPQLVNGAVYQFDQGRFTSKTRSTIFPNGPAGLYFPGDQGFPTQAGMNKQWKNVAPRVGFAWDPAGDGTMAIRAAYSRGFDFVNGQFHLNTSVAPPWGSEIQLNNPPGGLDNPFAGSGQTNVFPVTFDRSAAFSLFGPFVSLSNDLESTEVHQWNVTLERQFGPGWFASVGYLGSRTLNIWETTPLNLANPNITSVVLPTGLPRTCVPGTAAFQTCMNQIANQRRRLFVADPTNGQYFGLMDMYVSDGAQRYNGMVLSVRRTSGRGLSVNASYTLSKCFGAPDGNGGGTANPGAGYNKPEDPHFDDGYCTSHRWHNFSMTAAVRSPEFENAALRALASDWRLAGSFRAVSGPFLTVVPGSDRAMIGGGAFHQQRANQVLDDPYADRSTDPATGGMRFLSPAAFAQPALGTLGTSRRNSIEGIATRNLDVSLVRFFRMGSRSIEVRAEAFNVMNWLQWAQPTTNLSSANFGLITAAGAPRELQFAVKYEF